MSVLIGNADCERHNSWPQTKRITVCFVTKIIFHRSMNASLKVQSGHGTQNSPKDQMDSPDSFVEPWGRGFLKTRSKSAENVEILWCYYQPLLWKKLSETPTCPSCNAENRKARSLLEFPFWLTVTEVQKSKVSMFFSKLF